MFNQNLNLILTYLTLSTQIVLFLSLVLLLIPKPRRQIKMFFKIYGLKFAFAVAVVSTMGSLFYSEVVGYLPCKLCWYQRIFMYPQVVLLGQALLTKSKLITNYSLSLLFVGLLISTYHNIIYYSSVSSSICSIDSPVSCTTKYILELGYITIPLMSFTAFLSMIFLLIFAKKN